MCKAFQHLYIKPSLFVILKCEPTYPQEFKPRKVESHIKQILAVKDEIAFMNIEIGG